MSSTYYVHIDTEGRPIGPRAQFHGTRKYGYGDLSQAIRECPENARIEERHADGASDWAGRTINPETGQAY